MTVSSITAANVMPLRGTPLGRLASNRRMLSLADQAVMSAVNMATTIIIGRTCPKQQLGLYASGLSLILFVTAVQSALISAPYTISSPRIKGEAHRVYKGSTFLQQATLALISMLVFLGCGLYGGATRSNEFRQVLLMLAGCAGLICFRDFARRVSYAELNFSSAILLDCLMAVVQMAGIALLALTGNLTAARALGIVGLANGLAGALWLARSWSSLQFSWAHALGDFRQNWAFGRWIFGSSVLWSFSVDQYPWLLTTFRGASETAIWASCYGVMSFLNPCVLALSNDAAPRVANDYASGGVAGLRKAVLRSAGIAALITSPIVIGLFFFGGRLVKLMYGGKYAGAGALVAILTAGFWLYACSLVFPYGMLVLKRAGLDFTINIICFLSFLLAGLWMVRSYGAVGAACSFLMVQVVALISRVVGFDRAIHNANMVAQV